MITNVWSTPRTGSNWYSYWLRTQQKDSLLLNEIFNRNLLSLYTFTSGQMSRSGVYTKGSFYNDYFLDNGLISTRPVFKERTRGWKEEEEHRLQILKDSDKSQSLILHNHVVPINNSIRQYLTDIADKNIYIYRKDKRAQLASYAIAVSTNQFTAFSQAQLSTDIVSDIDPAMLSVLLERIKVWDLIEKTDVIAYEDIEFSEIPGLPLRQNKQHSLRLSDRMNEIIDKLVLDYENGMAR